MTSGSQDFAKFRDQCLEQLAADTLLPAGALRVGIQIVLHTNRRTGLAWPGLGRLEKLVGVDRTTVIRGVKALEKRGHIEVMRSRNGKANEVNRYRFIPKATVTEASTTVTPPSQDATRVVAAVPLGVVAALPPKPLSRTSERTSILIEASACADARQGGVGEQEGERRQRPATDPLAKPVCSAVDDGCEVQALRPTASAQPPSLPALCYALARELEGDRGAALVTLALRSFPPEEIFFELNECQRHGGDIGEYLGMKAEWQQ